MDFERICVKLNALLDAGKKAELRGALNMLNEVDIAEYLQTLDNDKMLLVFRLLPKDISAEIFWTRISRRASSMRWATRKPFAFWTICSSTTRSTFWRSCPQAWSSAS